MRRGVMHVGGEPDRVADAGVLDEGEQVGDLELAAARRPVDALRDRLDAPFAVEVRRSTISPSGMSAAITFQVAREFISSRLSHATCCGPRK